MPEKSPPPAPVPPAQPASDDPVERRRPILKPRYGPKPRHPTPEVDEPPVTRSR